MFQIRKEQMEAFDAHMMRKYEDRVIRKLTRMFPDQFERGNPEATRPLVQAGIRKAGHYGITEDDDVERFILVLGDQGMDFEKPPEMADCREILEDEELPPDAKVALIYRELDLEF